MVENKDSNDPMASALEKAKPYVEQLTFGSIMGFCSGYALKKVGKAAAVVVGCGFIALQTAASYGYIKLDWARISEDAQKKLDQVRQSSSSMSMSIRSSCRFDENTLFRR
jgi:uncharacterized membrane protein (Fun14 family)